MASFPWWRGSRRQVNLVEGGNLLQRGCYHAHPVVAPCFTLLHHLYPLPRGAGARPRPRWPPGTGKRERSVQKPRTGSAPRGKATRGGIPPERVSRLPMRVCLTLGQEGQRLEPSSGVLVAGSTATGSPAGFRSALRARSFAWGRGEDGKGAMQQTETRCNIRIKLQAGSLVSYVCSEFLATAADRDRCHICLQPKHRHPSEYDAAYWAQWLVFFVLLELNDQPALRRQAG